MKPLCSAPKVFCSLRIWITASGTGLRHLSRPWMTGQLKTIRQPSWYFGLFFFFPPRLPQKQIALAKCGRRKVGRWGEVHQAGPPFLHRLSVWVPRWGNSYFHLKVHRPQPLIFKVLGGISFIRLFQIVSGNKGNSGNEVKKRRGIWMAPRGITQFVGYHVLSQHFLSSDVSQLLYKGVNWELKNCPEGSWR